MGFRTIAQCDYCGREFEGTVYFLQVWAESTRGGVYPGCCSEPPDYYESRKGKVLLPQVYGKNS